MLETKELVRIAAGELIRVFGKQYLRDTYVGTCHAEGMVDDETFMFFLGIKGEEELPGRKANDHGWVVYGEVLVDAFTGEVKKLDYALE